jgi:hypothetical protein
MSVLFNNEYFNNFESFLEKLNEEVNNNRNNVNMLLKFTYELPKVILAFSENRPPSVKQNYIDAIISIYSNTIINTNVIKSVIESYNNNTTNEDTFSVMTNSNDYDETASNLSGYTGISGYAPSNAPSTTYSLASSNTHSTAYSLAPSNVHSTAYSLAPSNAHSTAYSLASSNAYSLASSHVYNQIFPNTTRPKSSIPKNLVHKKITPLQQKNISNYHSQMNALAARIGYEKDGYFYPFAKRGSPESQRKAEEIYRRLTGQTRQSF